MRGQKGGGEVAVGWVQQFSSWPWLSAGNYVMLVGHCFMSPFEGLLVMHEESPTHPLNLHPLPPLLPD